MPIPPQSVTELLELLRQSGAVRAESLTGLSESALPADVNRAATALVTQGIVTRFQAQQLLAGRHKGFRVGPYAIQDLLGRGGMGAVYLGEHLELRRKVAIKVLMPGKNDDQKLAIERFQREARAVAALDHPNIVRLFDVSRKGETPYLVMEYVQGETLQAILDRDGPFPYMIATDYIAQAAAGLQHAHEKGIIHRDIKPGNLIRESSGVIRILDMGLARSSSSADQLTEQLDSGAVVGTADFIAPEQGLSQAVDIRADIYSLGASFFALVIGKPPFAGNTTQKLLQHQLKNPPSLDSLNATCPRELSVIVAKMLAKKPEERYQSPAEVIEALAPWLENNSRILAGLSRINLGRSGTLSSALSGIGLGGSSRGVSALAEPEPSSSEAAVATHETLALSTSATRKDSRRSRTVANTGKIETPKRPYKLIGLGVALAIACVVAGWLAMGRDNKAPEVVLVARPNTAAPEQPENIAPPVVDPPPNNPAVVPPVLPPVTPQRALLQLDLAGLQPFTIRSSLTIDPNNPARRISKLVSQTGGGKPPENWSGRTWSKDTTIEFFGENSGTAPAIGIRNVAGTGAAMLFSPEFACPEGGCRIRIEYGSSTRDGKFVVRFKPADSRSPWDVIRPLPTGTAWRNEEVSVDLRGATGGLFEFHNSDDRPEAAIRFRSVVVTPEPKAATTEKVLFAFDAANVPAFKNTKLGSKTIEGATESKLPRGVSIRGWKPETQSMWQSAELEGVNAIGFANLNDVISAQIAVGLEMPGGVGVTIEPGQAVRLRVEYRTTGTGRGTMSFQAITDSKILARAILPNSNLAWKTADLLVTRPETGLRLMIDSNEVGEGNALFVRSIVVSLLSEPLPPNPTIKVEDDATAWSEGKSLLTFSTDRIPLFRVKKEKAGRIEGMEKLPAGISIQAWREGGIAEFRCEVIDGVTALGVTNFNDQKSGQFVFALEGAFKLALEPGKAYRAKVTYLTKNDAIGVGTIRAFPDYKPFATAKLDNSNGKWATAGVSFIRPPNTEPNEIQLVVANDVVGEGNTLWIRSIEVVELNPSKKK